MVNMICFCDSHGCGRKGGVNKSRSVWYAHKRRDTERRQKCELNNEFINPILDANTVRASAVQRVTQLQEPLNEESSAISIGQRSL